MTQTLLVILGAGASHDTLPLRQLARTDSTFRPPLTKELFDGSRAHIKTLVASYPELQALVARVQEPLIDGTNLEELLDGVVAESATNPQRTRQLMALRFYLADLLRTISDNWHHTLSGATNYAALLDQLDHWRRADTASRRVVYVTFNYDTLLEKAAAPLLRFNPSKLVDYLSHEQFALIRPHGCIDWNQSATDSLPNDTYGAPIQYAPQLRGTLGPIRYGNARGAATFPVPAIAIPLLQKVEFMCPAEHLETLDRAAEESVGILVIGWRGKEKHFNARLRGRVRKPHLLIADIPDVNPIMEHLMREWSLGSPSSASIENGGFSGALFGANKSLDTFLRRLA